MVTECEDSDFWQDGGENTDKDSLNSTLFALFKMPLTFVVFVSTCSTSISLDPAVHLPFRTFGVWKWSSPLLLLYCASNAFFPHFQHHHICIAYKYSPRHSIWINLSLKVRLSIKTRSRCKHVRTSRITNYISQMYGFVNLIIIITYIICCFSIKVLFLLTVCYWLCYCLSLS